MINLGRIKLPPIKNVLDVAMQTVRQQVPDKPGQPPRPPQNVRFANTDMGESCELSTMNETTSPTYQSTNPTNPFLSGQLQAEDSFTSYQNTYPQQDGAPRTQSMQSVDFYASSEEGGFEEGGGKPGAKINEFQAAWNVTNAIQGMFVVSLPFAVLQGGYWAIAAMIGIAHICCYTGKKEIKLFFLINWQYMVHYCNDGKMDGSIRVRVLLAICIGFLQLTTPYNIRNHPCCLEPNENLTLAMIIDAFEIYGHDPTDKLDNLWLYQNEMMRIKTAEDQYLINERVHIATDHLGRFIKLHIQELKVLLITLDDVIDNMLTMYENHNSIAAERKATYTGGPVPMEFYISQEFYCGKNVYLFLSELYSDIYNMGKGLAPYCKDRSFVFLGFLHYHDEQKYYLLDDPSISFPTDNYLHGLECHIGICIFRFPFKKLLQKDRDISTLPKAIVKCGLVMYKLPPLTASSCIITSGSFILDFNIQGLRYRHYDYLLTTPNGNTYYTKERHTPLVCDHHVCEWNYTNHYGGPFLIPGDPGTGIDPVPPYIETTPKPEEPDEENVTVPYILDGCLFMYPPNYGSIAGKSYLDPVELHDDRFTCNAAGGSKGLYWYPQWMGAMPHHPYPTLNDDKGAFESPGAFYPHQNYDMNEDDSDN